MVGRPSCATPAGQPGGRSNMTDDATHDSSPPDGRCAPDRPAQWKLRATERVPSAVARRAAGRCVRSGSRLAPPPG